MLDREGWEYATRNTRRPAIGVVAITDDGKVVLVEQHRPPAGEKVIEIPAGLAGDLPGSEQESLLKAAQRELLEETGYVAGRWTELARGFSSPGITDELIVLFLAQGLAKTAAGGGDPAEQITVHEVPSDAVLTWINARGSSADLKLLAGLYAARSYLEEGHD